jgi:tetratricopeptide (TPR) repeat protein
MPKRNRQRRRIAPADAANSTIASQAHWQPRIAAALAAICVVTALAYLPAMSGGLLWDDDAHVTKPELRSLIGLYRIWFELGATQQYYPLLHSAFWAEHKLWGDSVVGYHLANLVLHLAAVCLVYLVLQRLKIPGALLAAAVFALHPVHVETVAWISEQKNTLSAVFYLTAMLAYLRFDESRERSYYAVASGLFVLGLLTKTVIATLPAALLVIFWWQRGKLDWRNDVRPLVPFVLLGAAAGALTAWVERTLIGASGSSFELTLLQRGLLCGRVIWFYLWKLVWPTNLVFIYPRWDIDPAVGWQWLFPLAALGLFIGLYIIRRRWRSPLAAWLFFTGTLFPVLGFLNVYPFLFSFVADHFQYLASLGLIVFATAALSMGVGRLLARIRWAGQAACIVLVGTLALATWEQCRAYSDVEQLYALTLARNPDCWMAHNNLGAYLIENGRYRDSLNQLDAALRLKSDYAQAHNNRATALAALRRNDEAVAEYQEALRIKPDYVEARNGLGAALFEAGRNQEAMEQYMAALRLKPNYFEGHYNYGNALFATGDRVEAIDQFRLALEQRPEDPTVHDRLGTALRQVGRISEAIEEQRKAVQLKPEYAEAHNNLGNTLASSGRYDEAISEFERALELKPDLAQAENNLGDSLRLAGHAAQAIVHFQNYLRLKPNVPEVNFRLAVCFAQLNRPADAIAAAETALQAAQSVNKTTIAGEIEGWLSAYRAQQSGGASEQSGLAAPLK